MKNYINICLVLLVLFIFSCTKDANVKIPNQKPIPVVGCFFKPGDTLISLQLSYSQPLYASSPVAKETNAFVKIEGPLDSKILTYNQSNEKYEVKINSNFFQFGQKYSLYIKLSNGAELSSESIVPNSLVSIKSVSTQSIQSNFGFVTYDMFVKFNDEPSLKNFYSLSYTELTKDTLTNDTVTNGTPFFSNLANDNNNDGGELTIKAFFYNNDGINFYGYKLALLNCSKDYYQYSESLNKYNSGSGSGNPFAEPSFIYSNIKNGLGIFAAYTQTNKIYKP